MIDAGFVAQFFGLMDQTRSAEVWKPADEGTPPTSAWATTTLRKESLSVKDLASFAGGPLQGVSQLYSVLDILAPQVYAQCRIYDATEDAWFNVQAVDRTSSDSIQSLYCTALRPGLTPQLAKTGD